MPKYEAWKTSGGREGVQRTLDSSDAADRAFLESMSEAAAMFGGEPVSAEKANRIGIRRVISSKNICVERE
jgi:hypothetical protein